MKRGYPASDALAPATGGDISTLTVVRPNGSEMLFEVRGDEEVKDLQTRVADRLGIDMERHELELACGDTKIEDVSGAHIRDLPDSSHLTLIVKRVPLITELELALDIVFLAFFPQVWKIVP